MKTLLAFAPLGNEPPATNAAAIGWRNAHPYLRFAPQPATAQSAIWTAPMPTGYNGGQVTARAHWAAVPTTGTVGWDVTLERVTAQDIDSDGWATAQAITATTVDATSGIPKMTSVVIAAGAAGTDSIAAGDLFRLRVRRDLADTAAGDAQLLYVELLDG